MDIVSTKSIIICIGVVASVGMTGSAFQPQSAVQILGFSGVICAQLIAILQSRKNAVKVEKIAEKAAEHVAEVKEILKDESVKTSDKLDGLVQVVAEVKKVGDASHALVNSKYGTELKISMMALKRIAERDNIPADFAAFVEAERLYNEHMDKQAVADAQIPSVKVE